MARNKETAITTPTHTIQYNTHLWVVQLTIWLPAVVADPMDPTLFFFWKPSMTELMSCKSEPSASCRNPDICNIIKKQNQPLIHVGRLNTK